jgi:tetratricopeptide (TPR) repeat protein
MKDSESNYLIQKFEKSLKDASSLFFDVDEFEEIADYYLETGQLSQALIAINMGRDQHPYATTFEVKRARYFVASQQLDRAQEAIDMAESISPNHPDLDWARGQLFIRQGKHQEAIKSLKHALQNSEDQFPIQAHLASLYTAIGEFNHAIKVLKAMLREEPNDDHLLYMLAANFDMANKDEKSVEWFQAYLDQYPFSETGWYHLGASLFRLKKFNKAIEAYEYALLIDERFTAAYFDIGRIREEVKEYPLAIKSYKDALKFESNGYTYYRLGICFQSNNQIPEATNALKQAVKLDEDLDEAWIELAILFGESQKLFEAIEHVKKALSLDPENPDYYLIAYDLYQRLGLFIEGEKMLKLVLKFLRSEKPLGLFDYMKTLQKINQNSAAEKVLEVGIERYPESLDMAAIYCGFQMSVNTDKTLALELLKVGQNRYANIFIEKLLDFYPDLAKDSRIINQSLN